MGYSILSKDSYLSVPGLRTWLDGRFNVVKNESNFISTWGDISPEQNNLANGVPVRQPTYHDEKFVRFIGQSGPIVSLRSPRLDFNFLHNGQPHGVYGITSFKWDVPVTHTFLATSGASATGLQFLIQQNVSNGRVAVIVRNAGAIPRTAAINNLLPGFANEILDPLTPRILSQVFLGANIPNNQIMRFGDLVVTSTDTSLISEYNVGNHESFSVGAASSTSDYEQRALLLIYDWTGYTAEEILSFDVQIQSLLEDTKAEFT